MIAVIDYGSGNLRSAAKALERAVWDAGLDIPVLVTSDPEQVRTAERLVLPGQGAFADCRRGLAAVPGLEAALTEAVIARGRPFFGICVGMQLMADRGLEHGTHQGLGRIAGTVVPIDPAPGLKIPHMGWNDLMIEAEHPVLHGVASGEHAYFVHSYHFAETDRATRLASVEYGGRRLTAMVGRDNLVGTQFHPEKSQALGLRLLGNFLAWRP